VTRLSSDAVRTLTGVAEVLAASRDDWWLVGGAAVALHGLDIEIADVDVLMSERDIRRVMAGLGVAPQEGVAIDRVRSKVWVRWTALPLAVDLMTGLQIRNGERWTLVAPATREAVQVDSRTLYLPSRAELAGICRLFGRPKDLDRAAGLGRL
jgi:hypothetical protein